MIRGIQLLICLSHPSLPRAAFLASQCCIWPKASALDCLRGLGGTTPQKLPTLGLCGDSESGAGPPQAVILLQVRADFPSDKAASGLEVTVPFPRAVQRVSCEPEREPKVAHSQVAPSQ